MPLYRVPTLQGPLDLEKTPRRVVIVTNRASSSLEYIGFLQVFAETTFFLSNPATVRPIKLKSFPAVKAASMRATAFL